MLSIGLMSGTSMDGIDAALISTDGVFDIIEISHTTLTYTPEFQILLKAAEAAVRSTAGNLAEAKCIFPEKLNHYLVNELHFTLPNVLSKTQQLATYLHGNSTATITLDQIVEHSTDLHIKIVKALLQQSGQRPTDIAVIGYHGQTLFHRPGTLSLQVGDGNRLAKACGISVINHFRNNDITAGGQGAPFAPLYHQALAVRDRLLPAAVVNCGGIANITLITGDQPTDLSGFDTGPGNALIDRYIRRQTNGKEQMDIDGRYGSQGRVSDDILTALFAQSIQMDGENYFDLAPPKSLDSGDLRLIDALNTLSIADACATLEAFTAESIVQSIQHVEKAIIPTYWILAGGGWNNPVITRELQNRLHAAYGTHINIVTAAQAGWNSAALEAQIFAYLAVRSLKKLPISFPNITHVPEPLTGGELHPIKLC